MTNSTPQPRSDFRRVGFSLLELILVLVILGVLMVITWPSLRRPLGKGLVHEAARQLANDLTRARMLAIDSGCTIALRFEGEGTRYHVATAESMVTAENGALSGSGNSLSGSLLDDGTDTAITDDQQLLDTDTGDTEPVRVREGLGSNLGEAELPPLVPAAWSERLPHGVVFGDPLELLEEEDDDLRQLVGDSLDRDETEPVETMLDELEAGLSGADWSEPILFFPTGRSDHVEFLLRCPDGYRVPVTLRGLTGAVTIGQVLVPRSELRRWLDPEFSEAESPPFENTGTDLETPEAMRTGESRRGAP